MATPNVRLVRRRGLEPLHLFRAPGPKPGASTNFATLAGTAYIINQIRLFCRKQALYCIVLML